MTKMQHESQKDNVIFQFSSKKDLPIYISFIESELGSKVNALLNGFYFKRVPGEEIDSVYQKIQTEPNARILTIENVDLATASCLNMSFSSGKEEESLVPTKAHTLYHYRNVGILLYAFRFYEWSLYVRGGFGDDEKAFKTILGRYLALSLSLWGIVGLWGESNSGTSIDLLSQKMADGKMVFVDTIQGVIITSEAERKITSDFRINRPNIHHKHWKRMGQADLYASLMSHCSYYHTIGLSVPIRQMIFYLSKVGKGFYGPMTSTQESTRDLSY